MLAEVKKRGPISFPKAVGVCLGSSATDMHILFFAAILNQAVSRNDRTRVRVVSNGLDKLNGNTARKTRNRGGVEKAFENARHLLGWTRVKITLSVGCKLSF